MKIFVLYHKKIRNLIKKRKYFVSIIGLFLVSAIIISFYLLLFTYYDKHVLPNTHFSHFSLGGKNRSEVEVIVDRAIEVYGREKVVVAYGENKHEFSLDELGVSFDSHEVIDEIFTRYQNQSILESLSNLHIKKHINSSYFINSKIFFTAIESKFGYLDKSAIDASINFSSTGIQKIASEEGNTFNRSKLIAEFKNNLDNLQTNEIQLQVMTGEPAIPDSAVEKAYEAVQKLEGLKVTLFFRYDKWIISEKNFYDLLRFYPQGQTSIEFAQFDFDNPFIIKRAAIGDFQYRDLNLTLNNKKVDELLASISEVINKSARDATLRFEGGKIIEFASAQDGQSLKNDEAKKLIVQKVAEALENNNKNISIDLPVVVTKAKFANEEINKLGIRELIGSGVSYFAGSIPNRIHNIALGASLINGILIKPGETFSFIGVVGPVSAEQGFKQAYVIKSGRTVLDDGGGICQVSTTVFRAALNSGLPILKRTAHAYRVSYYEQKGFKAGLDATIFSPTVDLQFKNDTDHHVLIQTTVDRSNSRLQVDIYGTNDGRRTELSEPIVTNIIPAPEPIYQDDPTLPRGTIKQVDYAAAGATSVFGRKVYKNGQVIIDDTFKSIFRPWQAVYLVGTAG
ncbi:MAG: VanW family protein [Candidatus Curtissbacteria bacterium GW2011_GWA1_40_9]|uniref:VanW family protein n=1 Tax=Candidatus Curtissbacteria bacterium GW2011_GWA1_40_9 TaxID=1618408 RepID=A0A0G0WS48_9BACT|nr:MAG: VanW family protein [Candidatus Curtissbacteria bacterium GW2011_GWA1_40_9]